MFIESPSEFLDKEITEGDLILGTYAYIIGENNW